MNAIIDTLNMPAKQASPLNDYAIRGEMVTHTKEVNSLSMIKGDPHFAINLKLEMAQELGAELLKHGCIEFTSQDNPITFAKVVRARCFVVPSEDVQVLREKGF
jgi:hypothetical protein